MLIFLPHTHTHIYIYIQNFHLKCRTFKIALKTKIQKIRNVN